jgi:hypothetical protein
MPTAISDIAERVQDQVLEAVKTGQDAVVDSVRTLADRLDKSLPESTRASLGANLPAATEAVDSAFALAGRLLDTQHSFIQRVLDVVGAKTAAPVAEATPPAKASTRSSRTASA